ncbi:MAG TPA: CheR family methyltransferase [Solirubrobacteraceae bacterium]|jgi:chemotaxis protein methyltransferase CheR|nr:CheR family methyltransferase [Solirubrobacteraceae bacterium]
MTDELRRVAELVHRESGVALREPQLPALAAAIGRLGPGLSAGQLLEALDRPAERGELVERLIDEVTIKETFFFRHRTELEAIDWRMLLDAAVHEGRASVRAWSAACASGEEPYTLAIMASEALGVRPPPVDVLATDIAQSALHRARAGSYGWRSLRHVPESARTRYFEPLSRGLRVTEELRSCVRFARHNLVRDSIPPDGEDGFDLIVCRNVFIYFRAEQVARTIGALERCLRPHGMLVLGAADRLATPRRAVTRASARPTPQPAGGGRPRRSEPLRSQPGGRPESSPAERGDERPVPRPGRRANAPAADSAKAAGLSAGARVEAGGEGPEDRAGLAIALADTGRTQEAVELAAQLLADDPLDARAHYARGLAVLAAGQGPEAIGDLRRSLYLAPTLAPAAFALAKAYEQRGDRAAARRSYAQTLRLLEHPDPTTAMPGHINADDIAAACRARLGVEVPGG